MINNETAIREVEAARTIIGAVIHGSDLVKDRRLRKNLFNAVAKLNTAIGHLSVQEVEYMNDKDRQLLLECLHYCNNYSDREIHLKTSDISILISSKESIALTLFPPILQ